MATKASIQKLISKGKTAKALEEARTLVNSLPDSKDEQHDLTMIEATWSRLQRKIINGLLSTSEQRLEEAKLHDRLLSWLGELPDPPDDGSEASKRDAPQQASKIYNINHIDKADFS